MTIVGAVWDTFCEIYGFNIYGVYAVFFAIVFAVGLWGIMTMGGYQYR